MRGWRVIASAAVALGALSGAAAYQHAAPPYDEQKCKVAIQTNNVETDDRGYIYIVDRANTGMHILELTGAARAIAGLPPLR